MTDEPSFGNWLTHTASAIGGFLATPAMYYMYRAIIHRKKVEIQERHQQHLAALDTYKNLAERLESRVSNLESRIDELHNENLEYVRQVAVLEAKVKEQQVEIDELRGELSKYSGGS